MKTLIQALGLAAMALSFLIGCEFPTTENQPNDLRQVYLGKILYKPKFATFHSPLGITSDLSDRKISSVYLDFENQRVHLYGQQRDSSACYTDRKLNDLEKEQLSKLIKDLEFCEWQTSLDYQCLASFLPTESLQLYDYQKLYYLDQFPNQCSTFTPQLCNGASLKPIIDAIQAITIAEMELCH